MVSETASLRDLPHGEGGRARKERSERRAENVVAYSCTLSSMEVEKEIEKKPDTRAVQLSNCVHSGR